ncbi:hypothetical protein BGLA2_210051 [Burkholderia gladioli]|nr:hypothetical protein BGLA2_210051 [Burkholderia gladioli]
MSAQSVYSECNRLVPGAPLMTRAPPAGRPAFTPLAPEAVLVCAAFCILVTAEAAPCRSISRTKPPSIQGVN